MEREITFQDVLAFHEQLRTFSDAGVPIDLRIGRPNQSLSEKLALVETRLALELGRGQPDKGLVGALAQAKEIPPIYGLALESWFRCDKPVEALKALHDPATSQKKIADDFRYSLIQPLIILALVYFGMLYLSLYTTPQLEAMHLQIRQPLSLSLEKLVAIKSAMYIWVPAVPALILLAVLWCRQRSVHSNFSWLPGSSQLDATLQHAIFAENTACLLDAQQSQGDANSFAAKVPNDVARPMTDTAKMPAMLRWALTSPVQRDERSKLLRSVAHVYRQLALRKAMRLQSVLPVVVGAVIGGVLVLGYGLSLFAPVVQLIYLLSRP